MNYWLVKFAPFRNSWQDILKNGKFEIYSVRSAHARNNLKAMTCGDLALFYHSQAENCVTGIMKVIKEAHQDPTTDDIRWVSVTFEPVDSFEKPVSLKEIRTIKALSGIALIKQPRLAVMPLNKQEFDLLCAFGKTHKYTLRG